MKKISILTQFASTLVILLLCINGTIAQLISTGGVVITLKYGGNGPPINDKEVGIDDGVNNEDWDYTDASGAVEFTDMPTGTYALKIPYDAVYYPWWGGNAYDAWLIAQNFEELLDPPFTDEQILIGNVDITYGPIPDYDDADLVMEMFCEEEPYWSNGFPSIGHWYVGNSDPAVQENVEVSYPSPDYDLNYICYGDVDYSNETPYQGKLQPGIRLDYSGTLAVQAGSTFLLPISVSNALDVGSISLILKMSSDNYIVRNVDLPATCSNCWRYKQLKEELRISWYNVAGAEIRPSERFISLTLEAISSDERDMTEISLDGRSEISDRKGKKYSDLRLMQPRLILSSATSYDAGVQLSPNPARNETQISYQLPEGGDLSVRLLDIYGRTVRKLKETHQAAGSYTVKCDVSTLLPGYYFYNVCLNDWSFTGKLVIIH